MVNTEFFPLVLLSRPAIFILTLLLLLALWSQRNSPLASTKFGYLGVFIVNFISSATVLLPLPGVASVFLAGSLWNPLLIGISAGLGATFGEFFAYLVGFGGRSFINKKIARHSSFEKIEYYFHKNGFITIVILAALPFPIFDIVGILAGTLNYPVWKFLLATAIGRVTRDIIN